MIKKTLLLFSVITLGLMPPNASAQAKKNTASNKPATPSNNGNGQGNSNGNGNNAATPPNNGNGNGQGTGNGNGNVPVPADPNNQHGTINNGGNYNNGVGKKADVPFDAGLSILLGAGAITAFKRVRTAQKSKQGDQQ